MVEIGIPSAKYQNEVRVLEFSNFEAYNYDTSSGGDEEICMYNWRGSNVNGHKYGGHVYQNNGFMDAL